VKAVRSTLITAVVLAGFWVPLIAIGWIAGVLPAAPWAGTSTGTGTSTDHGSGTAGTDTDHGSGTAGTDTDHGSGTAGTDTDHGSGTTGTDHGSVTEDAEPLRAARWHLLGRHGTYVTRNLAVAHLVGDERPEVVAGCGTTYDVVTTVGPELTALRLARYTVDTAGRQGNVRARPDSAAIGDVTGDGRPDLVIAWGHDNGAGNGSRGGGVFLVAATARGELGRPRRVSGITARNVLLAELDERRGLDLVVADRGHPWRPHAPEGGAEISSGGARPTRRARIVGGEYTAGAALLERTAGEPPVVVVTSDDGVHFHAPARGFDFELVSHDPISRASHPIGGDVDGDGRREVLVSAEAIRLYASADPSDAVTLSVPVMDVQQIADLDSDGRADLVGSRAGPWQGSGPTHEIVVALQTGPLTFDTSKPAPWIRDAIDARFADLDGDGRLDLVITAGPNDMFSGDGQGACVLWLIPDALGTGPRPPYEERDLPDAPGIQTHTVR